MCKNAPDTRVFVFLRGDYGICSVWRGNVELRILGEGALAFLPMSVDVFPCLWSAINELVRADTDDVAVFVVKLSYP